MMTDPNGEHPAVDAAISKIIDWLIELESRSAKPPKPRWQSFLESTGGAALITVLLGGLAAGIVGTWLTNRYQENMKEREVALKAYNDYLSQGNAVVIDALGGIGNLLSSSNDIFDLAQPQWQLANYSEANRSAVESAREKVITAYNSAGEKWARDRDRFELLISYYHEGDRDITGAWLGLERSVNKYQDCTEGIYFRYVATQRTTGIARTPPSFCETERAAVEPAIAEFIKTRHAAARRQSRDVVTLVK
jgi:hypothetical protein